MKNNKIYIVIVMMIACVGLSVSSCDTQNLRDLDNPKYMLTQANADMSLMFTGVIIDYGRGYIGQQPIVYHAPLLKYYSTHSNLILMAATNTFSQSISDNPWGAYRTSIARAIALEDYLVNLDDPRMAVNLAWVRILKSALFMRMTDFYGDIPYTEAGKLAISNFELNKPKYDTQKSIYEDLLKTLQEEAAVLKNASAEATTLRWTGADIAYSGNMDRWTKFANSLMLRAAMRISEVESGTAKTYAELAIANGVITANADNYIMRTGTSTNPDERNDYSRFLAGEGGGDPERYIKLGKDFVDHLKNMDDPRKQILFGGRLVEGTTPTTAADMTGYWRVEARWDWNLDEALGVPHGIIANPESSVDAYHWKYTSPNPFLFVNTRPIELLTASEMLLLISEAASKGWSTGSYTAQSAYEAGIKANMSQLTGYSGLLAHQTISDEDMTDYIDAHPLGTGDAAKKRLAEEMWVAMYLNPSEGYFNALRQGLGLDPNPPGGTMPRRMAYTNNERSNNLDNLNEAISRRGWTLDIRREDEVLQRNWWDVL